VTADERFPVIVVRTVVIPSSLDVVWRFLSTDEGWAAWWGAGSTIDARPGGAMAIAFPNGQTAEGRVVEASAPRRLIFTYGFPRPDPPIPLDGSLVEVTLRAVAEGTELTLEHRLAEAPTGEDFEAGWRYQLGLFRTSVVRADHGPGLAARIDAWHAAWSEPEAEARRRALADVVVDDVDVSEPMAALGGARDLDGWIAQSQAHFPARVRRSGPPALTGDAATWDWEVLMAGDGERPVATGRSVARLGPHGRFRSVVAFWLTGPPGVPTSTVG
jgi:uncharacterized protein YndB with AHSA1/START domain